MKVGTVVLMTMCAALAQAQEGASKVGVINVQEAILRTAEGQKTAKELQDKYAPRSGQLEKQKRELDDLQAQLNKGRNTMSEDARNKIVRDIDQKSKQLSRDNDEAQADFQQDENKVFSGIGQKMQDILARYAKDKGFTVILDVSSPQTPVLHWTPGVDITNDIIAMYDKEAGTAPAAAKPAPSTPAPGRAPAAAPKPPAAGRPAPK